MNGESDRYFLVIASFCWPRHRLGSFVIIDSAGKKLLVLRMDKPEINKEEIDQLDKEFSTYIIEKTISIFKEHKQESTEIVFHYTNLSALIGIIENQCLWATDLHFLNDRNEYKHGMNIIMEVLESIKTKENESILHALSVVINEISKVDRYVACFSKEGDSLSQWRAYANNGSGISIGFNRKKLESVLLGANSYKYIIYDKEKQRSAIKKIIEEATKFFLSKKEKLNWSDRTYYYFVGYSVANVLDFIIASYKDPAFQEEQEYRIECKQFHNLLNTSVDRIDICHRTNGRLIIPYTKIFTSRRKDRHSNLMKEPEEKLPLAFLVNKLPIEKIIIGPSSDQEEIINGVKHLLQNNFYSVNSVLSDVEIVKSIVPYRS